MGRRIVIALRMTIITIGICLFLPALASATACTAPTAGQFNVTTLVAGSGSLTTSPTANDSGPIGITIAPDGSVFVGMIGSGRIMVYRPSTNTTIKVGSVPSVMQNAEVGFNGLVVDVNFAKTHWLYTFYAENTTTNVTETVNGSATTVAMRACDLVRYTVDSTQPAGSQLTNPKTILTFNRESSITQHMAGGLSMNQDGTLVLGTGDNSNFSTTAASGGYGPLFWPYPTEDAQRSSANTNDLRGKIIRIKPIAFPDNQTPTPGVGNTYTIPSGNLREKISGLGAAVTSFIPGWDNTDDSTKVRPEIYDFGARVPMHPRVDPRTGWIFWGDVGPNATTNSATRGPAGHDEWNLATGVGFFGHPYCNTYNSGYNALTSVTTPVANSSSSGTYGNPYDCNAAVGSGSLAAMINNSPLNTGIHHMPPALPSLAAYVGAGATPTAINSTDDDPRFNRTYSLTTYDHIQAAAFGGPMYRYDPGLPSTIKFPPYYEGKIFYFDHIRQSFVVITMNQNGTVPAGAAGVEAFPTGVLPSGSYTDMQFGPDGALYVLRYSNSYNSIGTGGALYRIEYKSATNPYDNACYAPFTATVGPVGAAAVPNVPTNIIGVAGNGQAAISWSAPSTDGGASITSYTVTSVQDTSKHCTTPNGTTTNCVVTGLTNGTAYTFTVTARNAIGTSSASSASSPVTFATIPGVPKNVGATAGNTQATVFWSAPDITGGAAIINYTAISNPEGKTCTSVDGATKNCTVTGLTNGVAYTFTVTAANSVGNSAASSASASSIIPSTVPNAPTSAIGAAGNGQVTVSWVAPSSNGSVITSYQVTSNPNGKICNTNGSAFGPTLVSNKYTLTMGPMTFNATAKNSGRIASLKYSGNEVLHQDTNTATNYGSTFWPSPQKYWTSACRTANNSGCFPPATALDGNTDSAIIGSDSSIMMSTPTGDSNTRLRFRKGYWANVGDSSFNIRYTMINTSSSVPDTFAPWEDTRIPAGGLYLFPKGEDTTTGSLASLTKDSLGVTWFRYDSTTVPTSGTNKFYSDGSAGWFAHIDKNRILFIKKFQDSPISKKAPTPEDEIELYTSNDKKLVEMELQGPFSVIAPNDSMNWDVKWFVRKIPDTMTVTVGNPAIVSYINQILTASPSVAATSCTIPGLSNGTPYTFTVTATNGAGMGSASIASASVTPFTSPTPPVVSYKRNAINGVKHVPVTADTILSTGGSVTGYSVTPALPSGLSMDTVSGILSGTPLVVSTAANYIVTATGPGGTDTAIVSIAVGDTSPSVSYKRTSISGTKNVTILADTIVVTGTGAITSYAKSSGSTLPSGITLDSLTGVISGTPTATYASKIDTVIASGPGGTGRATVTISVQDTAPAISYASPVTDTVGSAASHSVISTGGAVTHFGISPTLPSNLSLDTVTGLISGTPSATLTQTTFSIVATGPGGTSAPANLSITVVPSVSGAPTGLSGDNVANSAHANGKINVSWTPPVFNGGVAIDHYNVTATAVTGSGVQTGTCQANGSATTCQVVGLTGGQSYNLTVTAHNVAGNSVASAVFETVAVTTQAGSVTGVKWIFGQEGN